MSLIGALCIIRTHSRTAAHIGNTLCYTVSKSLQAQYERVLAYTAHTCMHCRQEPASPVRALAAQGQVQDTLGSHRGRREKARTVMQVGTVGWQEQGLFSAGCASSFMREC
eukprot:1161486-Pelagomonas_calceolata.AAC.12